MQEVRSMDCAQFAEVIHDLDRPGTEGFARREAALAHAESCSRCAILILQSEFLGASLQALAKSGAGRHASPLVEAALMEEFRRRKFASLSRKVKRQVAALGAAAAVLLAVGFWLHFSQSKTPATAVQTEPNGPAVSSPAPLSASASSEQPTAPPARASHSITPSAPANVQHASLTADSPSDAAFIRLPFADEPGGLDNDTVVRVVLTPATLASFGLPVTGIGNNEPIQADMVVSEDGTPEAVRLVSETSPSKEF
jgi:hypothetical protein